MGYKVNKKTSELEPWEPTHLHIEGPEWLCTSGLPFILFKSINWKTFAVHVTAYFMLLLFITPAWALNSQELDALQLKIIMAESSNNPNAIGDNGKARGLMQIQKYTWSRFTDWPWQDAFDPEKNVQVGRAILEDWNNRLGRFADEKHLVYGYNTGRLRFGALPDWTKKHPNKIYREIFNGAS